MRYHLSQLRKAYAIAEALRKKELESVLPSSSVLDPLDELIAALKPYDQGDCAVCLIDDTEEGKLAKEVGPPNLQRWQAERPSATQIRVLYNFMDNLYSKTRTAGFEALNAWRDAKTPENEKAMEEALKKHERTIMPYTAAWVAHNPAIAFRIACHDVGSPQLPEEIRSFASKCC